MLNRYIQYTNLGQVHQVYMKQLGLHNEIWSHQCKLQTNTETGIQVKMCKVKK